MQHSTTLSRQTHEVTTRRASETKARGNSGASLDSIEQELCEFCFEQDLGLSFSRLKLHRLEKKNEAAAQAGHRLKYRPKNKIKAVRKKCQERHAESSYGHYMIQSMPVCHKERKKSSDYCHGMHHPSSARVVRFPMDRLKVLVLEMRLIVWRAVEKLMNDPTADTKQLTF